MTEQHPITPPPELLWQWIDNDDFPSTNTFDLLSITKDRLNSVITQAAQWGADCELEACCEWLQDPDLNVDTYKLRDARRPKPPSLKEQALEEVGVFEGMGTCNIDIIRRALEQLDD